MWRASTGVIHCIRYVARLGNYKVALPGQTKTCEGMGFETDKHLPPNPFTGQVCKKRRPLGFGVFIVNWSMPVPYLFDDENTL